MRAGPAPLGFPFPHGPFLVERDGELACARPPALRFAWRGRPCLAHLAEGRLILSCQAGRVPFTAEHPALRPLVLAAIAGLSARLAAGWRLRLNARHALHLDQERPAPGPVTATALTAALVGFVLAADPYLERLASAGLAPAEGPLAPGSVNT